MNKFLGLVLVFSSLSAFAYKDGTYTCKHSDTLPSNTYKIRTLSIASGMTQPHVESTRYYRLEGDAPTAPPRVATSSGFAILNRTAQTETLMVGYLQLQFENDRLTGCDWAP